jgi:hypothetical protein
MHRRAFLKGAAAAIVAVNVAGTAIAAQPTLRQQAEEVIRRAHEVRIGLYSDPHRGGLWVTEPVDEPQTDEEMEVWHRLKRRMHDNPALKAEVKAVLAAA